MQAPARSCSGQSSPVVTAESRAGKLAISSEGASGGQEEEAPQPAQDAVNDAGQAPAQAAAQQDGMKGIWHVGVSGLDFKAYGSK